jgi:peroxiredoxin
VKRWIKVGSALVALQLVGIALYIAIEHRRDSATTLGIAAPEIIDIAVPSLTLRRRDGSTFLLRATGRPAVIHFWATWCGPCREEFPRFLVMDVPEGVDVLAVSLDARWDTIERFTALPNERVVLGRGADLGRALGETTLPVTYVMDARGRLRLRFSGARDWAHPDVVRRLRAELERR